VQLRDHINTTYKGDGRAAWQWLVIQCRIATTELEMVEKNQQWINTTFDTVGIDEDTIHNFSHRIFGLNAERPQADRKSETGFCIKLLTCLSTCSDSGMRLNAIQELQAGMNDWRFRRAAAGAPGQWERNFYAMQQNYDRFWRHLVADGSIRRRAARSGKLAMGAAGRPDALSVQVNDATDALTATGISSTAGSSAQHGRAASLFSLADCLAQEVCWNCRGLGHRREQCPSAAGVRPVNAAIAALNRSFERSRPAPSRGRGKGKGKGRGGRPFGRGGGRSSAPAFPASALQTEDDYYYDEHGAAYWADGTSFNDTDTQAAAENARANAAYDDAYEDHEARMAMDDRDDWNPLSDNFEAANQVYDAYTTAAFSTLPSKRQCHAGQPDIRCVHSFV